MNTYLQSLQQFGWGFIVIMIWDGIWKGLALWRAAREKRKYWFVALMVINSVGMLPLAYLIFVAKHKFWKTEDKKGK